MSSLPGAVAEAGLNHGEAASGAFDALAETYDASFTASAVGRALRQIVWARMQKRFAESRSILELGCGTGEDAIRLAGFGARVVAIDSSARMISLAREKARRAGYASRIEFHCMPMEQLRSALAWRQFDGVLSNFGAVNCVSDLSSLAADVAARLVPGAPLLWVVMGPYVPWEWGWYLARGELRKAGRRLGQEGAEWRNLRVYYPTPRRLGEMLQPHFSLLRQSALGFALPPSYAAAWLDRFPRALGALRRLETLSQRFETLAALADHYILEAVRRA